MQEVQIGERVNFGPQGGVVANNPVGPERTVFTGEVEIYALRTTMFDIRLP